MWLFPFYVELPLLFDIMAIDNLCFADFNFAVQPRCYKTCYRAEFLKLGNGHIL